MIIRSIGEKRIAEVFGCKYRTTKLIVVAEELLIIVSAGLVGAGGHGLDGGNLSYYSIKAIVDYNKGFSS